MNKLVPVVVVLLLLGVGGYFVMNSQKSKPVVTEQKTAGSKTQGGNIFTSIKDALSKSLSLKCEYPNPSGKGTVTSYIKNGAVRVSSMGMGEEGYGSAIMKDNKMWIWSEGKNEGMMLTLNKPEAEKAVAEKKEDQSEKVLAEMEKYKNSCKTEVVADSLFTPPSNVKFTDLEGIMKKATGDMMKQVPTGMMPKQTEETSE